jgi:hypothetical protein
MKKILLLIVLLTVSFCYGYSKEIVRGFVYEDLNGNGKKDKKENGIPGVAVSNGIDVVTTDELGEYALTVYDDNIIFVIKPAGYYFPLDEYNNPEFFYINKPDGSPKLLYPAVEPTGKLPRSIDFGMTKYDEPESFSSFVFGDSQVYSEKEIDYFKRGVVDEAKERRGVSFGITLGDLVGDNLKLHPLYKNAVKEAGLTWYNVMGNHDMNYDTDNDKFSDETFESNFGPNTYSFNYGKAHFIIMDDIIYPNPKTGKGYIGGFRKDQLEFLQHDLVFVPKDNLVVLCMHIPLLDKENPGAFLEDGRQIVYRLLKSYPNVLLLSAHTHIQWNTFIGKEDGADREKPVHDYNVGTTCGDWYSGILNKKGIPVSTMRDGTPKGYALLNIKGNKYSIDYKVVDKPDSYQISLYNPKVVPQNGRWLTSRIYANFFMGNDRDTLLFRVDNGEWKTMTRVNDYDPAYYRYVQDWDYDDNVKPERRPSNPVRSRHLWSTPIPSDLSEGLHKIEVRVTDMFGRTHTRESSYRIQKQD